MFGLNWPDLASRRWIKWMIVAAGLLAATGLGLIVWLASVPLPQLPPAAQSSKVIDTHGELIATLHGEENRTVVPLEAISPLLTQAVVAVEDRSFYDHRGFSLRGIARAARANLEDGEVVQGGSTITQQYVRNAFPDVGTERTLTRKIREAFWAVKLDAQAPKDVILASYLNTVYFGRGAYGVEAAARTYFKVSAAELSPGQAAYLAGMIRAPEHYQIDDDPAKATDLRNRVIEQLVTTGLLTGEQGAAAKLENLQEQFRPGQSVEIDSPRAGYFVEYVRRLLKSEYELSDEQILRGGLLIETTLDLEMQDAAEAAVREVLDRPDDPEAALVAMDPQGRVRAMVGGRDVDSIGRVRGFNFAADVNGTGGGRPAGSAFKTFALAAFVEQGKSVYSTFRGASTVVIDSDGCRNGTEPWKVSNYGHAGYGYLDVIAATTRSVNTIYAQMMDEVVTPQMFMDVAARLGIEIPQHDSGCALTLGTSDVTPLEMATAYTTFAQRGQRPTPLVIIRVVSPDGVTLAERSPRTVQAIDANVADTVNYLLERNVQSGTATRARLDRPAAAKTGTTDDFHDAWLAGYTPDLTAVVWMGYAPDEQGDVPLMDQVRGRSVTGGSFPAEIWQRFMTLALEGVPASDFVFPELSGEVIDHSPRFLEEFEIDIPTFTFPECFPFCGRGNPLDNLLGGLGPGSGRARRP